MSKKKPQYETEDDFDYMEKAGAATDMTGLIRRAITDEEEIEAYEKMYPYLPVPKKEK